MKKLINFILSLFGFGTDTNTVMPFYDPSYVTEEELRANKDIIEEATKHLR